MKSFFQRYSYPSVVLFLNQIAISVFGLVLALAAGKAQNEALKISTGVFAIAFFLFLQFSSMWRVGAEDRVSVELGKKQKSLWVPFFMWLLANSLNLLLAVLVALGLAFSDVGAFSAIGGVATTIKYLIEGMYVAVLSIDVGGQPLNTYWFMHFLTTIPSLIAVTASYACGLNNISFGGLFSPNAAPRE